MCIFIMVTVVYLSMDKTPCLHGDTLQVYGGGGAQWLTSRRASDSKLRGLRFNPYWWHCVVSLTGLRKTH